MRKLLPTLAAFCVMAGVVVGGFAEDVYPTQYLWRPLVMTSIAAALIGAFSLFARRWALPTSVAAAGLIAAPDLETVGVAALVFLLAIAGSIWTFKADGAVVAVAAVMAGTGMASAAPFLSQSAVDSHASTIDASTIDDRAAYVILLDGYPRADTLRAMGVNISGFVEDLEARGFTYYPEAESRYGWTHLTLTEMVGGGVETVDDDGTATERRTLRERWRLPAGFVTIESGIGHVDIPGVRSISGAGITDFEIVLLGRSALAPLVGDVVMDALRSHLDDSLTLLASTDETRVFAHLLSPHTPFLYGNGGEPRPAPRCWPERCTMFSVFTEQTGISEEEWAAGMRGELAYLNSRLLEVVDSILARRPDARIVLFSDHGGRISIDDPEEWHRIFLASRGVEITEPTPTALGRIVLSMGPSSPR